MIQRSQSLGGVSTISGKRKYDYIEYPGTFVLFQEKQRGDGGWEDPRKSNTALDTKRNWILVQ